MKSSSSPAAAYHHFHHHRAGYTSVWGAEEKQEECNRQGKDDVEEGEGKVRTMKKFLDRTLGLGAGDETVPQMDPRKDPEGKRGGNGMREGKCKEQEQEAEYIGQGSSQDQAFSSSQSSSQNHGYYSQQETPGQGRDEGDDNHDKLPPATVRRMSLSHMRLQEALSSPVRPPLPLPEISAAGPLTTPQSTQPQRRYSFIREPQSELSEYIHSDLPQQQTPIKPLSAPTLALPTPNPRRTNPQGTYNPPTLQKRSSSFLRLSTSLEGHAEVVIDTEPTLPPPLPHGLMTPNRGAPVPSTSSALRDIDNMRSSRVWEFCCDKQQQPYQSSSDGAIPSHHHNALEPDEAGMALSIARNRRKIGAFKDARRKLVFDEAALTRDDSGLGGMINGTEVRRRGFLYDDDGPFGSGKKPEVEVAKAALLGKKRISLGEAASSSASSAKPSTYPSASTCRKRTYHEVEIYEQPSSSQTTTSLPPLSERHALPKPVPDGKGEKSLSPPRGGQGAGAGDGGGEDYYIFGHESDKENYQDNGEKEVPAQGANVKQQRPVKALKKSLDTKDRGWRSGEKVPPSLGVVKKSKVKVNITGGDCTGSGIVGRGEVRGGNEKRVKKKRRILGEVAAGQGQVEKPEGVTMKGKEGREVDVDLGGAELLLSLSAGRWGC